MHRRAALALPLLGAAGLWVWWVVAASWSVNANAASGKLVPIVLVGPVMLVAGLLGWRTLWAAVAICQMAVGDGLADIVGRRFGAVKWPFAPTKSPAGSAAFVLGAFASSLGMVAYFHLFGYTPIGGASPAPPPRRPAAPRPWPQPRPRRPCAGVQEALLPLLAISVISAAVRAAPLPAPPTPP